MDDDRLIDDAWDALVRLAEANQTCKTYTWWARLHKEHGLLTVNETVFRDALRQALMDNDIAEYLDFLRALQHKQAERLRANAETLLHLDPDERTADW